MSCQTKSGPRPMSHHLLLLAGVAAAWFAQSALAGCPPGYLPKAGNCIPGPAQPHHPQAIALTQHAPVAVSPVNASTSSGLTSRPIPSGKAALNPQPIPPGHISPNPLRPPAHVGGTRWDVKKNKPS